MPMSSDAGPLLSLVGLTVDYWTEARRVKAVDSLDLVVQPGEFLGLIGESGSGKTTVAKAVLGLLPAAAQASGSIMYKGRPLQQLTPQQMTKLRGTEIGFVPQHPVAALNPVRMVGAQLDEIFCLRAGADKKTARQLSAHLLERVYLKDIARVLRSYPHELSGGMCQRAVLAMAVALGPSLLVADEPTTAVDASLRLQLLNEISRLQRAHNMGLLFISHDLALVGRYADSLAVMYGGRLVEKSPPHILFAHPRHPYTRLLLGHEQETQQPPESGRVQTGCVFASRCPHADGKCWREQPQWQGDAIAGHACLQT